MKPEFDSRIGHHVTVELLQKKAEVGVSPAAEESSAPYVLVLIWGVAVSKIWCQLGVLRCSQGGRPLL